MRLLDETVAELAASSAAANVACDAERREEVARGVLARLDELFGRYVVAIDAPDESALLSPRLS